MRVFNPDAILAQLNHRLSLLVGGGRNLPRRQQTMRASIGWSYDLLTPAEQVLFQRLAVFAGGCTMEAAKAVAGAESLAGSAAEWSGDELSVLEGIESLLDKHLLTRQEVNGETRFAMFETLREFALERLGESGSGPEIYQRYADYYADFQDHFYNRMILLEPEIDNFRAVMRWSIDAGQAAPGMTVAGNDWFWTQWNSEWRFWLEGLLRSPSAQADLTLQEAGVWHLVFQAMADGDALTCQARVDEYEAVVKAMNSREWQPVVYYLKGLSRVMWQDYEGAITFYNQGLKIYAELGFQAWAAVTHGGIGNCLLLLGQLDRAEASLQTGLRLLKDEDRDTPMIRAEILTSLGYNALEKGDLRGAQETLGQTLREMVALGYKSGYADCLNGLAILAQRQGSCHQAARLYGAVQALAGTAGLLSHETELNIMAQRYLAALRQEMDLAELENAWQEGQAMILEDALRAGLAVEVTV
jgi:tetratricopeptide (TPR) repeat protein